MTAVAAAMPGNSGNGTISSVSDDGGGTPLGTYDIICRGTRQARCPFRVINPSGLLVGVGVVGTAFDGPINFLLSDGNVPFEGGDAWRVTVS